MSLQTVYTVKSKNSQNVWTFKYNLNGLLSSFEVLDGQLSLRQINWFLQDGNFPFTEIQIKAWPELLSENFEIIIGEPDLSFDSLWDLYGYKFKRFESERKFNKLTPADRVRCFMAVPGYKKWLSKKTISQALLATFIHQRYFDDDWTKAK